MSKPILVAAAALVALGSFMISPTPAHADGGCIPGDIAGQVPRLTRPSDNVCVPPHIADEVQQENAAAAAGQGYVPGGGAYGPSTCKSGLVWREGYDGDAVCVSPQRRTETWQENANAGVGATGGLKPQTPPQGPQTPQAGTVVIEVTGTGTANTIDIYDPQGEPRKYGVPLPFSRTVNSSPKSGDLLEVVGEGKGDTKLGCRISLGGNVVAEQPIGGSGQCTYAVP
jgi:hypothetical protein